MKASTIIGFVVAVVILTFLCVAVLAAAVFILRPFDLPFLGRGENRLVLAIAGHRDEVDLYLLRSGQELERARLLAEDAAQPPGAVSAWLDTGPIRLGAGSFGGFLPNSRDVLLQYTIDDETQVTRFGTGAEQAVPIFEDSQTPLSVIALGDGQTILIMEPRAGQARCYASLAGAEAERIGRGDECRLSPDGSTILTAESSADGLTLTAIDSDGSDEVVVLDEQPVVSGYELSSDGSRVAYGAPTEENLVQVVVVSRQDGSVVARGEPLYSLQAFGFAPSGRALYYIGEDEEGDLALYSLETENTRIASGLSLAAGFSPAGDHLTYLVGDEEGEQSISVHPMAGGTDTPVLTGKGLGFAIIQSPERLLIGEFIESELTLYSAAVDGTDRIELFGEDDILSYQIQVIPGETNLYLLTAGPGTGSSLFVSPLDQETGSVLLEEWAAIHLLNRSPDGRRLIFAGQEDPSDDIALYVLGVEQGSDPIELDDEGDDPVSAVFTARGDAVLYTVRTGPASEEVEVRRVRADGRQPFEVLYPEASLIDVEWDRLAPLDTSLEFVSPVIGTAYCPGAPSLAVEETFEDELAAGDQNCYRLRVPEPMDLTLSVSTDLSDLDTRMQLLDRLGNVLLEDDDSGPGYNPRIRITLEEAGVYYIVVWGYSDQMSGAYSLMASEGFGDSALSAAIPLPFNEPVRGAVTAQSELFFEEFDTTLYGAMYTFEASAEDFLTVVVRAQSIGSRLEPGVVLFDAEMQPLAFASPEMSGADPRLEHFLASSGRYYLLITSMDEGYGTPEDYFFEVEAALGPPPEPSGGPISYGDSVEGYLYTAEGDTWTFSGQAGDVVTVTMSSDTLDTYLELYDPSGSLLTEDDDSGGNLDALINGYRLPTAGTYTIVAGTFGSSGQAGRYSLSLMEGELPSGGGGLRLGETVNADMVLASGDVWTFDGTAGTYVTVSMTSIELDCYLELYDPEGQLITWNDDGGEGRDALIDTYQLPATGAYEIVARDVFQGLGPYTLSLMQAEPGAVGGGPIEIGQTVHGTLTSPSGDEWIFAASADLTVTIAVTGPVDTVLELYDASGNLLTEDDDGGGDSNPLIEDFSLPAAGTYTILVRGFGGGLGSYTLTLE